MDKKAIITHNILKIQTKKETEFYFNNISNMLIGLSGKIGSGKSIVANHINKKYGFKKLSFREIILREIRKKGLEETRTNMQHIGSNLYKKLGPARFSNLLLENYNPSKNYVIDSIRHLKIHFYFKMKYPTRYFLIFIDAPINVRLRRLAKRDKKNYSLQSLKKMESHEVEKEIEYLCYYCDFKILNNKDIRSLYIETSSILEGIISSYK